MPPFLRIAAALLLAASTTGILSFMTSDRKGPGTAFADVLEQVRAARTMTYIMQIGDDPNPFRVSRMEPGLIRTELPGGGITVMDRKDLKRGEADRPIFRYRPQGSKTYRVIYGDLTVKDVEPGQIAK